MAQRYFNKHIYERKTETDTQGNTSITSNACLNPEKKICSLVLLSRVSCKSLKHLTSQLKASAPPSWLCMLTIISHRLCWLRAPVIAYNQAGKQNLQNACCLPPRAPSNLLYIQWKILLYLD